MSLWIKFNVSEVKAGAILKLLSLADVEELSFGVVVPLPFGKNKPQAKAKKAKTKGATKKNGSRKSALRDAILAWLKTADDGATVEAMKSKYRAEHGNDQGYYAFIKRLVAGGFVTQTAEGFYFKEGKDGHA